MTMTIFHKPFMSLNRPFHRLLLILPLFIITSCGEPAMVPQDTFLPGHNHLLLMHPTVTNIQTLQFLMEERILPLPADYRVVGVYHNASTYDFQLSADYIEAHALGRFVLHGIDEPLGHDMLFEANDLSPAFEWLFEQSEGVFFMGGPDLPPSTYGQPTNLLTIITDPHRHFLELSFLFHLLGGYQDEAFTPLLDRNHGYSVLGICLGMQTMNVATGGTMIQDIPTQVYGLSTVEEVLLLEQNQRHRNYYTNLRQDNDIVRYGFHQIILSEGSRMAHLALVPEARPYVLTSHHQAVEKVGKGFRVTAWCIDNLIPEAMEHIRYPHVTGVQFHPEVTTLFDPEAKLRFVPNEEALHSYMDLYPGDMGTNFHRGFWKHIALGFPGTTSQAGR